MRTHLDRVGRVPPTTGADGGPHPGQKGCAWALAGLLSWLPLFATTVKVWFVVGSVPVLTWMGDPTVQPPPLQTVPLAPEDEVHRTDE